MENGFRFELEMNCDLLFRLICCPCLLFFVCAHSCTLVISCISCARSAELWLGPVCLVTLARCSERTTGITGRDSLISPGMRREMRENMWYYLEKSTGYYYSIMRTENVRHVLLLLFLRAWILSCKNYQARGWPEMQSNLPRQTRYFNHTTNICGFLL